MKHDQLCAIGHNLADSLACGFLPLNGYQDTQVFVEAASSAAGLIEIDFLNGRVVRGNASEVLKSAAARCARILPEFCRYNGAHVGDFAELSATFIQLPLEPRMLLSVRDSNGRHSVTEYTGLSMRRLRAIDDRGRIRRTPRQTVSVAR